MCCHLDDFRITYYETCRVCLRICQTRQRSLRYGPLRLLPFLGQHDSLPFPLEPIDPKSFHHAAKKHSPAIIFSAVFCPPLRLKHAFFHGPTTVVGPSKDLLSRPLRRFNAVMARNLPFFLRGGREPTVPTPLSRQVRCWVVSLLVGGKTGPRNDMEMSQLRFTLLAMFLQRFRTTAGNFSVPRK